MKSICPACAYRSQGRDGLCIECWLEKNDIEDTTKRRYEREARRRDREYQKRRREQRKVSA